jgi:hypothetical protein
MKKMGNARVERGAMSGMEFEVLTAVFMKMNSL